MDATSLARATDVLCDEIDRELAKTADEDAFLRSLPLTPGEADRFIHMILDWHSRSCRCAG